MNDLQQQRQEQSHRGLRHPVQCQYPQRQPDRCAQRQRAPRKEVIRGSPVDPKGQANKRHRRSNQQDAGYDPRNRSAGCDAHHAGAQRSEPEQRHSGKAAAFGLAAQTIRDLPIGERGKDQHQRRHHPERAAPPLHRREHAADDRPAQMTGGEGALRDRDDAGARARVEHTGDQRHAAARDEPTGPPLYSARRDQRADVWRQRAAHRAQRKNTRTKRIGAPGAQAPPYHAGRGAADDRADGIEHRRPGVEARAADVANDGRHDNGDDQHLRGVHRDAADYQRRI